jgi:diphthamide biosynthesis protein 7
MFTCPAEVWCANFVDANTVVTGGDEGSWKIWDLRMPLITNRPVHHGTDDFGAGVTVLAPHPRNPKLLAVGSYDETVALFDLRKTTAGGGTPEALYHSESLGGGIWRCKWHPYQDHKLLVAAMHGGCVVGAFDNLESHVGVGAASGDLPPSCEAVDFRVQKEFKVHKSMAYGIDWLASGGTGGADAAASCSFYDKAMYLWNAN